MTKILQLTFDQQSAIIQAAAPLQSADRQAFREQVLAELAGVTEVGPGVIHRTIRTVQRQYWTPPTSTGHESAPRHVKKL